MDPLSVCAAVLCRDGKLLLATRRPGGNLAGKWEFPGGKINPGESKQECIVRELQEELGLELKNDAQPMGTLLHHYPERSVELWFMLCHEEAGSQPVPREGQQCGWFTWQELQELELAPADRRFAVEYAPELAVLCAESRGELFPAGEGVKRLPPWLKRSFNGGRERAQVHSMIHTDGLHTVCEGAKCPNRCECWRHRTATFMILGDTCTRACRFCSVKHGRPALPDPDEPRRIAANVAELGIRHAVVTCVTRDDLKDGGAAQMAAVVEEIRRATADQSRTEVLVSDYRGDAAAIDTVLAARPAVFGHNIETVERLTPSVRSVAEYRRSLQVLEYAAKHRSPGMMVKSGFMLGLGESAAEIRQTLLDLKNHGVDIVTIGQYLRPTGEQLPVERYVTPEEFLAWSRWGEECAGLKAVVAGPFVRSSYQASQAWEKAGGCGEGAP